MSYNVTKGNASEREHAGNSDRNGFQTFEDLGFTGQRANFARQCTR